MRDVLEQLRVWQLVDGLHEIITKLLSRFLTSLVERHLANLVDYRPLNGVAMLVYRLNGNRWVLERRSLYGRVVDVSLARWLFGSALLAVKAWDSRVDNRISNDPLAICLFSGPVLCVWVSHFLTHLGLFHGGKTLATGNITSCLLHLHVCTFLRKNLLKNIWTLENKF